MQYKIAGTADYIAPEIIQTHLHDQRVDIWSFGVLVFEMIVGMTPFNDDHLDMVFQRIVNRDILE